MTKDILRKHSHVSSFGAIQRDCENTVKRLQEKLQEEVNSSVSFWPSCSCYCGVVVAGDDDYDGAPPAAEGVLATNALRRSRLEAAVSRGIAPFRVALARPLAHRGVGEAMMMTMITTYETGGVTMGDTKYHPLVVSPTPPTSMSSSNDSKPTSFRSPSPSPPPSTCTSTS